MDHEIESVSYRFYFFLSHPKQNGIKPALIPQPVRQPCSSPVWTMRSSFGLHSGSSETKHLKSTNRFDQFSKTKNIFLQGCDSSYYITVYSTVIILQCTLMILQYTPNTTHQRQITQRATPMRSSWLNNPEEGAVL